MIYKKVRHFGAMTYHKTVVMHLPEQAYVASLRGCATTTTQHIQHSTVATTQPQHSVSLTSCSISQQSKIMRRPPKAFFVVCIGSKASNTRGYSTLTCIPEKTVPISDFTLSYLCHVKHANKEADIVEDAVCVFLIGAR